MPPNKFSAYLRFLSQPPDGEATDGDLLDCFRIAGDQGAFAELIRRHGPTVYGVCRRVLAHEQDAEDAFQTVFLMFAQHAGRVDRQRVVNWLYTVACRVAMKAKVRRLRRDLRDQRAEAMTSNDVQTESDWDEIRVVLDDAIQALSPHLRSLILLCDLGGKTHREAANELGLPSGSVSGLIDKARRLLRDALLARGVTLSIAGLVTLCGTQAIAAVPPVLVASAAQFGKGVVSAPSSTTDLAQSVAREMLMSKLRKIGLALALVIAITAGAAGFAIGRNAEQASEVPAFAPLAAVDSTPIASGPALAPAPRPVPRLKHRDAVVSLVVSPDGSRIASSAKDGTIRVWDAKTGIEVIRFDGPNDGSRVLAFDPKGIRLTVERADGKIIHHWLATTETSPPLDLQFSDRAVSLQYSADGRYLGLVGHKSLRIVYRTELAPELGKDFNRGRLLTRTDGKFEEAECEGHEPKMAFAFRPDGRTVVLADTLGEIFLVDLKTGKSLHERPLQRPDDATTLPTAVALDVGGQHLAWGGPDGEVFVLDLLGRRKLYQAQLRGWGSVRMIAFAPTRAPELVVADDSHVAIIRGEAGRLTARTLSNDLPRVESIAFLPGGETTLIGFSDGRIRRWSMQTREESPLPEDAP